MFKVSPWLPWRVGIPLIPIAGKLSFIPKDEQQSVYNRYRQQSQYHTQELPSKEEYQAFLADVEGIEALEPLHEDGFSQHFADASYDNQQSENRQWYTEHYFIDPIKEENTVAILQDQAVFHAITGGEISKQLGQEQPKVQSTVFTLDRYNADTFQGIMPDTGAAGVSTAGQLQFQALQKIDPRVQLDTSTAGVHGIVFGKGSAERSKGTIQVETHLVIHSCSYIDQKRAWRSTT